MLTYATACVLILQRHRRAHTPIADSFTHVLLYSCTPVLLYYFTTLLLYYFTKSRSGRRPADSSTVLLLYYFTAVHYRYVVVDDKGGHPPMLTPLLLYVFTTLLRSELPVRSGRRQRRAPAYCGGRSQVRPLAYACGQVSLCTFMNL